MGGAPRHQRLVAVSRSCVRCCYVRKFIHFGVEIQRLDSSLDLPSPRSPCLGSRFSPQGILTRRHFLFCADGRPKKIPRNNKTRKSCSVVFGTTPFVCVGFSSHEAGSHPCRSLGRHVSRLCLSSLFFGGGGLVAFLLSPLYLAACLSKPTCLCFLPRRPRVVVRQLD